MLKKKKVNMKKRKVDIKDKFYDISKIDLAGKEDLKEVLNRLKEHYIKDIFTIADEKNMSLKQICVTVFKNENKGFDREFPYFVFSSYFANPKNRDKKVPISIFAQPTLIKLVERDTKNIPLTLDFLESNINNAIIFTFTERKHKIEVEMALLKGDEDPVFDYHRDIEFINPNDYGYIASTIKLNDLNKKQFNFEKLLSDEYSKKPDLLYIVDKEGSKKEKPCKSEINKLKEKDKKRLIKLLNEYKENEILIIKCRESFKISDLFFKKDNYYVVTFLGILVSYEEVPFFIHDLKLLKNINGEYSFNVLLDSFRIKTKHLFDKFEFITSIGKNMSLEDNKFKHVYFNYDLILNNSDIKKKFKNQLSIYEYPTYDKLCNL